MNKDKLKKELLNCIKEKKIIITKDNYTLLVPICKILYKKGLKKISLIFTEKGNVPTIHEAVIYIENAKKYCLKNNIELIPSNIEYKSEKPKDLLDNYNDINIKYQKGNFNDLVASIIIPVYNRANYLKKTLQNLEKQKQKKFEVIIVDDGSTEEILPSIKEMDLNLKYLYWSRKEPFKPGTPYNRAGPLRNLGVKYAEAKVIIFLDCDIIVESNFIDEHLKSHEENDIVIGPSIREKEQIDVREDYFYLCNDNIMKFPIPWTLCHEGNISFKKIDFDKIGGFSSDFIYWAVEGDDLAYRMINYMGKNVILNRNAAGIHLWHPSEYIDEETRIKGMIYNGTILYKKHLDRNIYDRYFINSIIKENEKINDMKDCIIKNNLVLSQVARMTYCIEIRKCKHVKICKCRPKLIKQLLQKQGNIFFRFDDVYKKDEILFDLIDFFVENKIPINLEIIPGRITEEMNQKTKQIPKNLIEIHQHGWMHTNHSRFKEVDEKGKYEFGKSRTLEEQKQDIIKGKDILKDKFQDNFYPIFTPPFHGYDKNTKRILDKLGFKLSAWEDGMHSVNVDVMKHYKGKNGFKKEDQIIKEIIDKNEKIGIVLHTNYMNQKSLDTIKNMIKLMKMNDNIRFRKMSELFNVFKNEIINYLENIDINIKGVSLPLKVKDISLKETYKYKLYFITLSNSNRLLFKFSKKKVPLDMIINNYKKVEHYNFIRKIYYYEKKKLSIPGILMEFIDGKKLSLNDDKLINEVIKVITTIHKTEIKKNHKNETSNNIRIKLDKKYAMLRKKGLSKFNMDKIKFMFNKRLDKYEELEKSCFCHGDFSIDNLLIDKKGNIKVIDLESMRMSEPAIDIIKLMISLNYHLQDENAKKIVDSYLKRIKDDDLNKKIELLFPIILFTELCYLLKLNNYDSPTLKTINHLYNECNRFGLALNLSPNT